MVESFLKYLEFEKRYSRKTIGSYRTDLVQFSDFLATHFEMPIQEASYPAVRSWLMHLSEGGLDAVSINRKAAALRSFFRFAMKRAGLAANPMTKIRALKVKKTLPHFVEERDMVRLLDHIKFEDSFAGWRDKLLLELFYGTGMRLSELISLRESAVNLHDQTLKVTGKRNKQRVVPFPDHLKGIITSYIRARNREIGTAAVLFVTDQGKPLYPMFVQRTVKRYLSAFDRVEKKSPHVLRHTYATHLLNKGADINAVKDLLGHSSLAATQVYTHNSLEKLKKAYQQAHPKA